MLQLFIQTATVFNRVLLPDSAGGESASFNESPNIWRIRITPVKADYSEDAPGREYPEQIRLVGEVRDDLKTSDQIEIDNRKWEITSLVKVKGTGSIPDYFRAKAVHISEVEV
ncbi:MAG: hypothetical protein ABIG42_09725 [bacterium]